MTKREHRARRKPEEIVDGEIVGDVDSGTLLNLPPVPDDSTYEGPRIGPPSPAPKPRSPRSGRSTPSAAPGPAPRTSTVAASGANRSQDGEDVSRRQLITRLIVGGTAALALGGGAALLRNQLAEPEVIVLPNGSDISNPDQLAALAARAIELENQLAQVTAERDRALSERDAALEDLAILQQRCGDLETLNTLWEEHNAVGLDDQIRAALLTVGTVLRNLLAGAGLLRTGLTSGQAAVTAFTSQFALPQAAVRWLQMQSTALAGLLETLTAQVEQVVTPVATLAQGVAEFVLWVLNRLPFGAGSQARAGLEAMRNVITTLPELIDGINSTVMNPLATWFSADPRTNLSGTLITPIKGDVLTPASDLLDRMSAFDTSFQESMTPVEDALAQRDAVMQQIALLQAQAATHRKA